ncbi:hypothetical protein PHLGIDRAFT_106564 [Phlebiopsis gigantea 11061_1 CR5-6]|uniref:GST N-terminal domain-containing protein n=1 Tax=Phlebiopsis gigantea (strain 11061_1 CR5-6) TaxID=745531 RepID=A0A0C3SA86_PHLG1|nr:hypothetical protein PHLGIDRAFT_106564 [Phlebiopsis gigantea 11061_1 CR5-6]
MSTETSNEPAAKKQKKEDYVLYYWPGIPGRGEHVRLAFEYVGIPYTEVNEPDIMLPAITDPKSSGYPPHFAPPALKLPSGRIISQTPAILNHIAPKFGLAGKKEGEDEEEVRSTVNQLVLTALDLNNETHDVHHPISSADYYEDQKTEAAAKAKAYRALRLPKYLGHFEAVLQANPDTKNGARAYLVGTTTTTADLVLFQIVDGVSFAFPKRVAALKATGKYDNVFALKERVEEEPRIKEYLASGRRQPYSLGIFRHYEELDGEE